MLRLKQITVKQFAMIFEMFLPTEPLLGVVTTTTAIVIAAVSAASALASGAMAAVSAKQQGEAAEEAAKYNNAIAQNDAIAAQNAAAFEARQIRRKNMLRMGAQRAAVGQSGVSLDAGSSFDDVMFDSAIQGELEAQAAIYSGAMRSQSALASGQMALWEGKQARRAAGIGMASSAIGAVGGVAGAVYQGNQMVSAAQQPRINAGGGVPVTGAQTNPAVRNLA
jgi:hypothetical protein